MSTRPTSLAVETEHRSLVLYAAVMVYLVLVKVVLDLASIEAIVATQAEIFAWPMIGFVVVAGGLSVWLQPRVGLPALLDPSVSMRKRLLLPALVGLGLGVVNLVLQAATGYWEVLAEAANVPAINVPFPESVPFYSGGAIVLEAIYRLIIITLPLWLIANVILRKRGQTAVFWVLALLTAAHEPIAQASLLAGHPGLMLAIGGSTYAINLFEVFLFRRNGFLAPLSFRLAYYLVWHVVGSVIGL